MADLSLTIPLFTPGIGLLSERLNEVASITSEMLVGVRAWNTIAKTCDWLQMKVSALK